MPSIGIDFSVSITYRRSNLIKIDNKWKKRYSLQKYILGNKNVSLVSLKLDFFVFEMYFPFTVCYHVTFCFCPVQLFIYSYFQYQVKNFHRIFLIYFIYLGFFFFHRLPGISRQDKCITETVSFNSNFVEFMLPFLGIDYTQCRCDEPCQSVDRFVRLYIYRKYVYR